jgi:hypothetical protein
MSRRKHKSEVVSDEPLHPPPLHPLEQRANDDGFAFPLGENAEISAARFFCQSPICPGYKYRASDQKHPAATCGTILSSEDSAANTEEIPPVPVPPATEPVHEIPQEAIEASTKDVISSTIALAMRVEQGGVNESNVSTDMPPLDPTVHYEEVPIADDSPAAREEPLPPALETSSPLPDLPSPREAQIPRLVTDEASRQAFLNHDPKTISTLHFTPKIGSFWAQYDTSTLGLHCFEVQGVNVTEDFAIGDLHLSQLGIKYETMVRLAHFANGELVPYLTAPPFLATTRSSDRLMFLFPQLTTVNRGIIAAPHIYTYVPRLDTWWEDGVDGTIFHVYVVDDIPRIANGVHANVGVYAYTKDRKENREIQPFARFIDHSLTYIDDPEGLPQWLKNLYRRAPTNSPPADPEINPTADDNPIALLLAHVSDLANELGTQPLHVARLVDGILQTFSSVVTLKELATTSPVIVALLERLKSPQARQLLKELVGAPNSTDPLISATLQAMSDSLDKVVQYINKDVEPRIDKLESSDDQLRNAGGNLFEDLIADVESLGKRLTQLERNAPIGADELKANAPPKPVRRSSRPKRKGRAKARGGDSGPPRTGPGRPPGTTVANGAKPPVKVGRGHPKGSKTRKKALAKAAAPSPAILNLVRANAARAKLNKTKARTGKQPAAPASPWKAFMGKNDDPKILALLKRIAPTNVKAFLAQAKNGMPAVNLTPWSGKDYCQFASWHFHNR